VRSFMRVPLPAARITAFIAREVRGKARGNQRFGKGELHGWLVRACAELLRFRAGLW
jgi:hypothetical protein